MNNNQLQSMAADTFKKFADRYKTASENRARVERLLQLANRNFTVQGLTENDLDSTGILYLDKLRNKLSSLVMNSNYIWAYIEPPKWANVSTSDKLQFEEHTRIVFDVIQETSNFETEKAKILSDYLIGTTAFKVNYTADPFNPAQVEHCPIMNIYLGNDRHGQAGDVFYLRKGVTKYTLADSYGEEILQNPYLVALKDDDRIDIWEATIIYQGKILYCASKNNSFSEIFYYEEMRYNPWVVARCELLPSSPYGCGPCIKAVMEILGLKAKKKNVELIGKKMANPPWVGYGDVEEIMRSRVNTPNSVSIFSDRNTKIEPLQQGYNPEIEMFDISEHKEVLRDIFYIDFITAIKDVDDLKNVTATATQVAVTKFAEQIEPMYSMVQKELLKGVVMKTYECCKLAHLISTEDIDWLKKNPRTSLRYYNAIVIAQDQEDLQNSQMFVQALATYLGPSGPAAAIRQEKFVDSLAKRYRVKSDEYYLGDEFIKRLEEIQQAQAQAEEQGGM